MDHRLSGPSQGYYPVSSAPVADPSVAGPGPSSSRTSSALLLAPPAPSPRRPERNLLVPAAIRGHTPVTDRLDFPSGPRGVAQPGSAPALGAGGRRFKSGLPDQDPQLRSITETGQDPRPQQPRNDQPGVRAINARRHVRRDDGGAPGRGVTPPPDDLHEADRVSSKKPPEAVPTPNVGEPIQGACNFSHSLAAPQLYADKRRSLP